jgi:hypothetical protein
MKRSALRALACARCWHEQSSRDRVWCEHRGVLQAWHRHALVIILSESKAQAEQTLDRLRRTWSTAERGTQQREVTHAT